MILDCDICKTPIITGQNWRMVGGASEHVNLIDCVRVAQSQLAAERAKVAELERQLAEAKKALGKMRVIFENRKLSTLAAAGEMFRIPLEGLKAIDAAGKERG